MECGTCSSVRAPPVVPEIHGLGDEAASLVQPERRDVPRLRRDDDAFGAGAPKPVERPLDERAAESPAVVARTHGEEPDPSGAFREALARDVPDGLGVAHRDEDRVGRAAAALVDPGLVEGVAACPRKVTVLVEARVVMARTSDRPEARAIAVARGTDVGAVGDGRGA